MERPALATALATLACVNPACQLFRQSVQGNLVVRKIYGRDALRLFRCRTCGEAFSAHRGTALCNLKVSESKVVYLLGYKQMNTRVVARHNGTSRLRNQRKV